MISEQIIVVRGPIAIGKTSVVQELAKSLDEVAVIPVDWLRHMVVGWSPDDSAQALLAARNAAVLALNFCEQGFRVLIDGLFDDPGALAALHKDLQPRPVRIVTLIAPWDTVAERHAGRPENERADLERVRAVYDRIAACQGTGLGLWLDITAMTPAQVAEAIVRGERDA